ncbi:MAG: hypothetical protein ACKV0T_26095 [Planctomycetales bacterium]
MSPKEGVFYAGLMSGLIIGVTGARLLELHQLIGLFAGVVIGAGLGYFAQQTFIKMTKRDDDDRDRRDS